MQAAEASVAVLMRNEALKQQRRTLEKTITKYVQQIAATQDQVRQKSSDLIQELHKYQDPSVQVSSDFEFKFRFINPGPWSVF